METRRGAKEETRLFPGLIVLGFVLLAAGQLKLLIEVRRLKQAHANISAETTSEPSSPVRSQARFPGHPLDPHENPPQTGRTLPSGLPGEPAASIESTVAALEQRLNELSPKIEPKTNAPRAIAEYNVRNPPPIEPTPPEPEPPDPTTIKRNWGEEQVAGPPDTAEAMDAVTAWASRQPDGGPEWLQLDFETAVDVAEVRIRESFNPGAISKVTGLVNGQEVVLWEGAAQGGAAPRDFVVPVDGHLQANSVVVHLDTARVPGWNEIDAVELVGKDGTRQWARSASASSSYADASREHSAQGQLQEALPTNPR
jgi:hypothetical protein